MNRILSRQIQKILIRFMGGLLKYSRFHICLAPTQILTHFNRLQLTRWRGTIIIGIWR